MHWLSAFERQPLFAVCLAVAACAAAEALWRRTGRPALLNPVLVSTTVLAVLLLALEISCDAYIRQAQPINEALALVIVLLAVPLCRQFVLIRKSGVPLMAALVIGSAAALASALLVAYGL